MCSLLNRRITQLQRNRQLETGAFALHTIDTDLPPHQLRQHLGDMQPQTGTTKAAGDGAIRLLEGAEESLQYLLRHADPLITDTEAELLLLLPNMQHNLPFRGKLEGVPQQIDQHLANTLHISQQLKIEGDLLSDHKLQRRSLRLGREDMGNLINQLLQIKWDLIDLKLAGLNFGEVKNIIHQRQLTPTGEFNRAQQITLIITQATLCQNLTVSDNRSQRSTQLMAHRGEELIFRLARTFGTLGAQQLLQIVQHHHPATPLLTALRQGNRRIGDRHRSTILAHHVAIDQSAGLLLIGKKIIQIDSNQLGSTVAQHLFRCRIGLFHIAIVAHHQNPIRNTRQNRGKPLLLNVGLSSLLLGPTQIGQGGHIGDGEQFALQRMILITRQCGDHQLQRLAFSTTCSKFPTLDPGLTMPPFGCQLLLQFGQILAAQSHPLQQNAVFHERTGDKFEDRVKTGIGLHHIAPNNLHHRHRNMLEQLLNQLDLLALGADIAPHGVDTVEENQL